MDRELASDYFRSHGLHVAMTFCLLLAAFIESYYMNCRRCIDCYNPVWCELGWIYVALAIILLAAMRHYRKP
jgi:hypothetical protein